MEVVVDEGPEKGTWNDPKVRRAVRIGKYLGPAIIFVPYGLVIFIRALGRTSRGDASNSDAFLGAGLIAAVLTVGLIVVFAARNSGPR
jgi:hypothetical protein